MNTIENYYDYLGISETSSDKVIRRAYKKISLLVHPDKLKGASSDEFNKLKSIYDILSDPVKKAAYDKQLEAATWQQKHEALLNERKRILKEQFRAREKEAELRRLEAEKRRQMELREAEQLRQDTEDMLAFDMMMQAIRRKRMEDIIQTVAADDESDTEYSEAEVMKIMGL